MTVITVDCCSNAEISQLVWILPLLEEKTIATDQVAFISLFKGVVSLYCPISIRNYALCSLPNSTSISSTCFA